MDPELPNDKKTYSPLTNNKQTLIIFITLTIILLFFTLYFASKYYQVTRLLRSQAQQTSMEKPITSKVMEDPALNWKSYTNGKYMFLFKYPSEWTRDLKGTPEEEKFESTVSGQKVLTVAVNLQDSRSRQKVINDYLSKYPGYGFEKTDINGLDAVKLITSPEDSQYAEKVLIQFPTGYSVEISANEPSVKKYLDNILKTFRFETGSLGNINTSKWHVYNDRQDRFSTKIPIGWTQINPEQSNAIEMPLIMWSDKGPDSEYWIEMEIHKLPQNKSIKEMILADTVLGKGNPDGIGFWDVTVNGIDTYIAYTAASNGLPVGFLETSYIPYGDLIYLVSSKYAGNNPETIQNLQLNLRGILKEMILKCNTLECAPNKPEFTNIDLN